MAMVRLADGDRSAFPVLLDNLWPMLFAFAKRSIRHEQDAEDIAQEVFVKICSRIADFDPQRDGVSWAFRIAAYEILTHRRRRQRRRETSTDFLVLGDPVDSQEERLIRADLSIALEYALGTLSDADRIMLNGVYGGELEGVAAATYASGDSVRSFGCKRFGGSSMVNLEQLRARGMRAYEAGRLLSASRVAFLLAPLLGVCLFETRGRDTCGCLALALLVVCVWLRWRDREGERSVRIGLAVSLIPLVTGLALFRLDLVCAFRVSSALCIGISVLVGSAAGVVAGLRHADRRGSARWLAAACVAALAASCGCARLGVASVIGVALGTLVASTTARLFLRDTA